MGWGLDPRKWRKIGVYCEDLWGIPACRAEIGNWTVVIIGCGIDVVPINQNCWINKKCSRFLCQVGVQKMFELLALPLLIMVQYLQQWFVEVLSGSGLFIYLSFYLSLYLYLCLCVSLSLTNIDCFFPSIHVVSSIQSIAYFIHHLSLEWSTFTHLKLNTDWHGRLSAFTEFQHFHSACTSAELIWLCLWKQLRSMRILLRLTPRITHNYSAE